MKEDALSHPEYEFLRSVLGSGALARCLAKAPGGWRDLSETELEELRLGARQKRAVLALQGLVRRSYPELPKYALCSSSDVGCVYGERLGGLVHEVILAVALDGRNNFIGEALLAKGGAHGACVRPADVLRPMIRMGASAFVLVHNHPSGDPKPSREDLELTRTLVTISETMGMPLVDHVIVAGRGGGYVSLFDLGLMQPGKENNGEEGRSHAALPR